MYNLLNYFKGVKMKRIVMLWVLCVSFMFAELNLQTASKDELMGIKGIGEKKAEQIIEYRKTNKINTPDDLKNIKGFGDSIVSNVKNNETITQDKANKKSDDLKNEKKKELEDKKENINKNIQEKKEQVLLKK